MNVLFITWDGPQVNYFESLFLPIFIKLREYNINYHVIQFGWSTAEQIKQIENICLNAKIPYKSIKVFRRPLPFGALLSALIGARKVKKLLHEWSIDILMPRSTLPALVCLQVLKTNSIPVIFDADGLPLDERVDFAGASASSITHRFLRDIEAQMVRRSDIVLTRTRRAVEILVARAGAGTTTDKFYVVSNGRNSDQFALNSNASNITRNELGIDDSAPLLAYAGSLGQQYCVPEMLELFRSILLRKPKARLLILSGQPELAEAAVSQFPLIRFATIIKSVPSTEVSRYLASADLGIALRRSSFSMQAVAPIKLGEYLLCGLPVVATKGIGDTTHIFNDVGFLAERLDSSEIEEIADWFSSRVLKDREGFAKRSRKLGLEYFSLESSVNSYVAAFSGLPRP